MEQINILKNLETSFGFNIESFLNPENKIFWPFALRGKAAGYETA